VAIDGDRLVAGSPKLDPAGTHYGAAYVFRRDAGGWTEEVRLTLPGSPGPGNAFGSSVAIEGDVVVVGAYELDRAYVYRRNGTQWLEEAVLTGADTTTGDIFGWAVSISGGRIVVGAIYDHSSGQYAGSVYVFVWTGTNWVQEATLNGATGDVFGSAVSLSGDQLLIGAPGHNNGAGTGYVFARNPNGWVQRAKLTASDAEAYDLFGGTVALHGALAMVGAPRDSEAGFRAGALYVFQSRCGQWVQTQKLLPLPGDGLGVSLGMDGTHAVSNSYVYFTPPLPSCVPALSRWGVVVMILGIAAVAAVRSRKLPKLGTLVCAVAWTATASGFEPNFNAPHHPEHVLVRFKPATTA